jgi:O-acetyl-ADP-ribose deacetylase (regulator of RNase III)
MTSLDQRALLVGILRKNYSTENPKFVDDLFVCITGHGGHEKEHVLNPEASGNAEDNYGADFEWEEWRGSSLWFISAKDFELWKSFAPEEDKARQMCHRFQTRTKAISLNKILEGFDKETFNPRALVQYAKSENYPSDCDYIDMFKKYKEKENPNKPVGKNDPKLNDNACALSRLMRLGRFPFLGTLNNSKITTVGGNYTDNVKTYGGVRFHAVQGNIVLFTGDIIVNAANHGGWLTGASGVQGAIQENVPESELQMQAGESGTAYMRLPNKIHFGETKCMGIVHALSPDFRKKVQNDWKNNTSAVLAESYNQTFELCAKARANSVAFPVLSAGVFRGSSPYKDLAFVCVQTLKNAVLNMYSNIEDIFIFAYSDDEFGELNTEFEKAFLVAAPASSEQQLDEAVNSDNDESSES